MRQYGSPAAFRAAVDERLRNLARRLGVDALILRRRVALERLLARLTKVAPGRWALKGGLALETRLGERARPSMDLDADHAQGAAAAREDLQHAIAEDLGDHFSFAIIGSEELREGGLSLALLKRFLNVRSPRSLPGCSPAIPQPLPPPALAPSPRVAVASSVALRRRPRVPSRGQT